METGLIVGLFVGLMLLIDSWCESMDHIKHSKTLLKFICGTILVVLTNIGLFYV